MLKMLRGLLCFLWIPGCVISLLVMAASCKPANSAHQKVGGFWTLTLANRTFLVLALTENGDKVAGTLSRPSHFQVDGTGTRFSEITSDEVQEVITTATLQGDHLRFTTANPKDPSDTSDYDLAITATDQATLKMTDAPFDPWPVVRVPSGPAAVISKDWDAHRSYRHEEIVESSIEMQKIYEADQKPRQNPAELTAERWTVINREDTERRTQTAKLLAEGQLHTAQDFNRAAFIFQHGSTSDDYLLAHTLAMIAVAKGDESSLWIGSATLDRYLQSAGKPQIYGTQFKSGKGASQEPFDRSLISDSLRAELGVPSLAKQLEQQKYWMEQFKTSAGHP
jgi:hypothetical protein